VLVLLGDEGLGADGLLTAAADEAGLVPRGAAVLQLPGSWRRRGGSGHQQTTTTTWIEFSLEAFT